MDQDEIFNRLAANIREGGENGRGVFLRMAKKAYETAGREALEGWTELTFFQLPPADQTIVVAMLLDIAFTTKAPV
jgi:hypothetical protein